MQLDFFLILEDISPVIQEASSVYSLLHCVSEGFVMSVKIQVIWGLPIFCSHTACTKMAVKLAWILTHIQGGFQSHSSQGCNTEEKQDAITHNIYSQQGGAHWAAEPALGCGKESHGKAKAAAHSRGIKLTRHTHTVHIHPPRLWVIIIQVTHTLTHCQTPDLIASILCRVFLHNFQHTLHVSAIRNTKLHTSIKKTHKHAKSIAQCLTCCTFIQIYLNKTVTMTFSIYEKILWLL